MLLYGLGGLGMRIPGSMIIFFVLFIGALALIPVISFLQIEPLPGDMTVSLANHHVFLPFTQSLIASVVLALLFSWAKK